MQGGTYGRGMEVSRASQSKEMSTGIIMIDLVNQSIDDIWAVTQNVGNNCDINDNHNNDDDGNDCDDNDDDKNESMMKTTQILMMTVIMITMMTRMS